MLRIYGKIEPASVEGAHLFDSDVLSNYASNYGYVCKLCHESLEFLANRQSMVSTLCCHLFHLKCLKDYS
jgi:hypothetical protein